MILRIAPTAGKILPNRLSNTGELNFNIIIFSNRECSVTLLSQGWNYFFGVYSDLDICYIVVTCVAVFAVDVILVSVQGNSLSISADNEQIPKLIFVHPSNSNTLNQKKTYGLD